MRAYALRMHACRSRVSSRPRALPAGLLPLQYKHGSLNLGLESYCCPSLRWIGLRSDDVTRDHVPTPGAAPEPLPEDCQQPFTARDRSILNGLLKRAPIVENPDLRAEAERMQALECKVEVEALYCFGIDYLVNYLVHRIVVGHGLSDSGEDVRVGLGAEEDEDDDEDDDDEEEERRVRARTGE